jgi:hypothetical protein
MSIMNGPVKKVTLPAASPIKVDPRERVAKRGLKTKVEARKSGGFRSIKDLANKSGGNKSGGGTREAYARALAERGGNKSGGNKSGGFRSIKDLANKSSNSK